MRLDVLTIFPDYLSGLRLSLIGKAVSAGLLSLDVRDLREHTHDRHRTVDDTPYGGGAGMVMCPEPWGEALDAVLADAAEAGPGAGTALGEPTSGAGGAAEAADERPVLIVPSPAGDVFDQAMARELAGRRHLVFACGRYEGIDQRVIDDAAGSFDVRMVSIGDYVLNGGEVATMVMVEAIARLLPGVIGNPASLDEESHEDGLLEYPVYTKPAEWRGRRVPDILLSGDHGRIARWRRDERLRRTAAVRPDLLAALDDSRLDAHDRRVLDEIASAARAEAADGDGGVERDR